MQVKKKIKCLQQAKSNTQSSLKIENDDYLSIQNWYEQPNFWYSKFYWDAIFVKPILDTKGIVQSNYQVYQKLLNQLGQKLNGINTQICIQIIIIYSMKHNQIIDQMKKDLRQRHFITPDTLLSLKKLMDQIKAPATQRQDADHSFKEEVMEKLLESLNSHPITPDTSDDIQKSKKCILEILERDFVSTPHNLKILQKLVEMLQKDSEEIAIQSSKALDFLIKHVNQNQTNILDKSHYIPLLQFLKERSEFLLKLNKHLQEPQFNKYKKIQSGGHEQRAEKTVIPNSKSIQFFTQLPNLLIHFMAYVDIWKGDADEARIKQLLKQCIVNIIQAPKKIPYNDLLLNMNQEFNSKIFAVMIKFLQYMFILFKAQKDQKKESNNKNLKRHFKDQIEHIKIHQVLMNFLHLLKNCPDDFPTSRTQVINRLKLFINIIGEDKLSRMQASEVIKQLLNQDVICGKNKFIGEYSKNLITNYWLDSIKSPIILYNMFPAVITNIKIFTQQELQATDKEVVNSFFHIQNLFGSILKIIFDNSLYLSVQERALETLTQLIDRIFPKTQDNEVSNLISNGLTQNAKKFHSKKLDLITQVLDALMRKFGAIDNMFREITKFINSKKQSPQNIKDQQKKMDHLQLQTLPSPSTSADWQKERADFVEKSPQQIDASLLTLNSAQNKFLSIYEQEEQLSLNSHPIKPNNAYNYIKDVKNKIIQKCISLCHRITQIFINQNNNQHSPSQMNLLKSVYYYSPLQPKKVLTEEQCRILGNLLYNGLKVFEQLHDYDFHSDQVAKKVHLRSFMLIFAHIYDPINFRDIFEPNMEVFFQQLLKYAKYCSDNCLQWVLIQPFCANPIPSQSQQTFNKNIVQLLIYNLIIKLEHSPDQLDLFHPFYEYKDQYFSLLQKLIRFPFRCLSRYSDDSFIRNYFRQIVLFLVKKSHTSRFSLDYLHLMRTLFKNILYNCHRENTSPLFIEFQAICSKTQIQTGQPQYNNFSNVNVLENLHKLFETGIPELADIVTQLVIMLPLKSKHIIQYARQGYIVKPLLHCLCMMNDYNYTLRTIKTFEIIISHSSSEEISQFLEPIKFKLINRLFEIVSQCKINELRSEKISSDLSSLALKLLSKLGSIPRMHQQPLKILPKQTLADNSSCIQIAFTELKTQKKFKLSIVTAIEYSAELFEKLGDQSYQTHVFSIQLLETAFNLLRQSLPLVLEQMHDLAERLIVLFSSLLSLHSKYVNISPNLLTRIREGVKDDLKNYSDNVGSELALKGLTDYSRFFLKCLLKGLSEKVLITRQDQGVPEISQQPRAYLWTLLNSMLDRLDPLDKRHHNQLYTFLFEQLMSQCIDVGQNVKNSYNLPMKQASLAILNELIDKAPQKVIYTNCLSLIETVFIVSGSITDILNLKIAEYPKLIANKLFAKLLKNEYLLQHESWKQIFTRILNNLVSYSVAAHNIAMDFLNMLCQIPTVNVIELLYEKPWAQIQDTTSQFTMSQSKYSIKHIIENITNLPIINIIKPAERIFTKVNQAIGQNQNILRLMTNTFNTLQWLISIPFQGKKLQALTIISEKTNQNGEKSFDFQESLSKVIEIARYIISINEKEFGANIKIILESVPTQPPANTLVQNPRARQAPGVRAVQPPNQPPAPSHNHSINQNIYFDDQEYNLNIQDIDLQIKLWGELISSIIRFLKETQLCDNVFQVTKFIQKKKSEESQKFIDKRSDIIFTLFNLVARVDRTVRSTSYKSLKELISKQQHPKQLLNNQEKLKSILKPMLFCLQQEFKRFTPSLLFAFRKILKLLTQCFNNAVIQKLQNHLNEIEKTKDPEAVNARQRPEPLTYAQLMHQIKCISSLLGLFQYLSFAYQSTNPRYTINSIQKITGSTKIIAQYFTQKLGKQTVEPLLKQNLAKLINTMSPLFPAEVLFNERNSNYFPLMNQMLGMDLSYCVRQRMTRDLNFAEKLLDQSQKGQIQFMTVLNILKTLAFRNTSWFKKNSTVADKLLAKLNTLEIDKQEKQFQTILLLLVAYARQNKDDTRILFQLAKQFKVRSTIDMNFLRSFFKYELYNEYPMATKKRMFLQFVERMKNDSIPIEDKIVINYNMIYQMLMQANQKDQIKTLISKEDQTVRSFIDLMKETLNVKKLQTRNAYNYRVAIQVLQLSSFIIRSLQKQLTDHKRQLLTIIWALLKADDKMLKNYAFICTSNFIRIFDIGEGGRSDNGKVLTIYLTLLKGMQALTQHDFQLGALNRKALNILIPYWAERRPQDPEPEQNWISWTLRILHDESNQPFRLVRFWEIVVKNHQIFQKSKQGKFETQMINSMQWLMVASNPASNSPMVKRIASDLSFIYIQWKYKDVCDEIEAQKLLLTKGEINEQTFEKQRKSIIDRSMSEKAAEICLNFFIKVAFHNCTDKEDKDIMKRFLYLLKKMLVLWPNTKKKFDQIQNVIRKLRQNPHTHNANMNPSVVNDPYLRFHYAFLNIINTLLQFQQDSQLNGKLMMIFNLFELGQLGSPQRPPGTAPMSNSGQSLYTVNNSYLLHLIINILKRLLSVAYQYKDSQDSQQFIKQLKIYVKEGLENYVLICVTRRGAAIQPRTGSNRSIFRIELVISVMKLLFDFEKSNVTSCLNYLKQVAGIFKKNFQIKSSNSKDIPSTVPEGTFRQMLAKQSIISLQLFPPQALIMADENYEKEQMSNSYICKRLFMVIVLRILASQFNQFHIEDKNNIMEIFSSVHNKTPDPALKSEILNLWRCMFMGKSGFADGVIPKRYQSIEVINFTDFPLSRVFIMLFDDTSKFAEHFDKRKIKPTDQNFNLTEKILEEINTKQYFDFLCQIIKVHGTPNQLSQLKLFALFACKICDIRQLEPLFKLIQSVYGANIGILYTLLFQDFKEFNCAEEYLQGDEVMLFFTRFLQRLVLKDSLISLEVFGAEKESTVMLSSYNHLIKADLPSPKYNTLLVESFNTFVDLLPQYNKLGSIITDYLLKANVSNNQGHTWGLALLKMALNKGSLSPQQLYLICSKIGEWGILQHTLQNKIADPRNQETTTWLLDNVYSVTSQPDILYGFRMHQTSSKSLKNAFTQLQQRQYANALQIINSYDNSLRRQFSQVSSQEVAQNDSLVKRIQRSYASDIMKECIKQLNEWDSLLDQRNKSYDIDMKVNFLFTQREDKHKDKIKGIVNEMNNLDMKGLPFYYGRTMINFLESTTPDKTKECLKEINVALLFSLLDWMNIPKYSKFKQNQILIKTQCLLELQEGNKIKQETISSGNIDANHDAMTKVVQSIFNEINTWRERLPHKFQNMSTWRSILDQRNMIFRHLRKRMQAILDPILTANNSGTSQTSEKLLIPYQDVEWNSLSLIKQQRIFGIYSIKSYKTEEDKLYSDEIPMKIKQLFYYNVEALKNYDASKQIIERAISSTSQPSFKIQYQRLKADLLSLMGNVKQANNLFSEVAKTSQQESYILYRDWLNVCYKGYEKSTTNKIQWVKNAITLLPYALKANPKKCRLEISTIFTMLSENIDSNQLNLLLKSILEELPIGTMLLWIPQIVSLAINPKCAFSKELSELLQKGIGVDFPQAIFYTLKKYKLNEPKSLRDIYTNIRRIKYNLLSKMEGMVNLLIGLQAMPSNLTKIPIAQLGALSRCFSQLYIPSYDYLHQKFENQMQKIPLICQIGEDITTEVRNGKQAKVVNFLASDQKHYFFRLQKRTSSAQSVLASQCVEVINNSMEYYRQSYIRKLKIKQTSKTFINEETALVPTSGHTLTLLDVLNDFMGKTNHGVEYPENDKTYSKLPKNEANKFIHKRMLQIVPENQLKRFIQSKCVTLDDYYMFRKQFGYNYGPVQLINYIFGNQCALSDIIVEMSTAGIEIDSMKLRMQNKESPFSVRLSRNIYNFLTDAIINGAVLPSMIATVSALLKPELRFKSYLNVLFKQFAKLQGQEEKQGGVVAEEIFQRMKSLVGREGDEQVQHNVIPSKMRIILETAKKIGFLPSTPINLKYWF